MANVILKSSGWILPGASAQSTIYAWRRDTWQGPPPRVGQRPTPAQNSAIVGEALTDPSGSGYVEIEVPEATKLYLGELFGRRWVMSESPPASADAAEQERAEGAEQQLADEIEQLRHEAPGTARMVVGINSNSAAGHAAFWTSANVFGDRSNNLDQNWATPPATFSGYVAASLAAGCKSPLPIINSTDTVTLGTVSPSAYAAGAVAIIERILADHPTVKIFQLINEPYYKNGSPLGSYISANGSTYGAIVKATYELAKTAGLLSQATLMVEAFGEYEHVSAEPAQPSGQPWSHWIDDVCIAMRDPYGMVVGSSKPDYANFDATSVERAEGFQFTCRRTGPVGEIRMRTSSVANTGITSVRFGVATDNAGKPGTLLGEATRAGEPGTDTWISATFSPSFTLTEGVKYWLVLLPLGTPGKSLHYMAATPDASGTGDRETTEGKAFSTVAGAVTAGEWAEVFNQGPIAIMAGTELARPLYADINGWSNHPYGSLGPANIEGNFNYGSTSGFRTRVTANGAGGNGNWWLTEWGWPTEGERSALMQGFLDKALLDFQAGWLQGIYAFCDGTSFNLYGTPAGEALRSFAKLHG